MAIAPPSALRAAPAGSSPGARRRVLRATFLASLGLALLGPPAGALPLSLSPATATLSPGSILDLTLSIGGLGDGTAPSLKAYTVKLDYDPALLAFEGAAFGSALGTPCPPGDSDPSCQATADADDSGGVVTLTETSLLVDLSSQPGSFELATLAFRGLPPAAGRTETALSLVTDDFTELVTTDNAGGLSAAAFDTPLPESTVAVVPEPGPGALLALGLAALGGRRRAPGR